MHFLVWGALGNEKAGGDIRVWGKAQKGQCLMPLNLRVENGYLREAETQKQEYLESWQSIVLKKINIVLIQMESKHLSKAYLTH